MTDIGTLLWRKNNKRNLFLVLGGGLRFSSSGTNLRELWRQARMNAKPPIAMNRKPIVALSLAVCALLAVGCGSKEEAEKSAEASPTPEQILAGKPEVHGTAVQKIELTSPLNQEWVGKGKAIYDMKCLACHKLTADKLVGPGWKDVTKRRQPEWIINMVTNVDMMLEKDPEAQKLLEQCLVRMPNLNITQDEARQILEFMRNNDGEK